MKGTHSRQSFRLVKRRMELQSNCFSDEQAQGVRIVTQGYCVLIRLYLFCMQQDDVVLVASFEVEDSCLQ